ncbi:SpaH/EbpB family LPXTG-anchored major pilin [Corynebacterium sanguinis]|uniref:SpaH/EbpB family LPXTG-anchored major pilin n=1 Tax=Corynebacterium sanguinis TaxID=2594913 RepID=UPI00223BE073|nr:SpaH/EbpB family LPXTG-anchored major pilin [Corynebacterium sanguinis]MCT2287740.1 SpaH/EbpB family LPXTG-anchored major pilin [Corynebacterium sanguinis]
MARSVSKAAVIALSAGIVLAGAGNPAPAFAQPAVEVTTQLVNMIDYSKTGSITVVKSTDQPSNPATGLDGSYTPTSPLAGVTFELYKVQDITNASDFIDASKLTVETAPTGTLVGTQITPANGRITFGNLPVGLYRVHESDAPAGVSRSADYLVFVPMTNPETRTEWNYNPVTYPKNSLTEVVKTVQDAGQNVGDTISYTIQSNLPNLSTGQTINRYEVTDQLDAGILSTTADQVTVVLSAGPALVKGEDYTVSVSDTQLVTVTFTSTGAAKLTTAKQADSSAKVVTTIDAKVIAVGDGTAENEATVIHNNPSNSSQVVETPSNEVTTKWAKLRVHKTGEAGKALAGAEFDVYRCEPGENGGRPSLIGEKLTVNGRSHWVTDDEGNLVIDGLHVTDVQNGSEAITNHYCLNETKAPEGYELLTDPILLTLNSSELTQQTGDVAAVSKVLNVQNVTGGVIKLPLTGGLGIGVFALLGALIIAGGIAAARRRDA